MLHEMYRKLFESLRQRGGLYAARDIPEFYALAEALFVWKRRRFSPPCLQHPSRRR